MCTGLLLMPPTRTLNTSRPQHRLQVTSRGPRNQPDQPIVRAHSVQTSDVVGEAPQGSLGFRRVPWSLGIPEGCPSRSRASLGEPQAVQGRLQGFLIENIHASKDV